MERIDYETKGQVESASSKIQEKTVEASSLRLENERLKVGLSCFRFFFSLLITIDIMAQHQLSNNNNNNNYYYSHVNR